MLSGWNPTIDVLVTCRQRSESLKHIMHIDDHFENSISICYTCYFVLKSSCSISMYL